ncbi:DEAD/DEAH box helicase family protein, partial [Elusimicrobiota bacterium]
MEFLNEILKQVQDDGIKNIFASIRMSLFAFICVNMPFKLKSKFKPSGDQPKAIKDIFSGLKGDNRHITLLGTTGSGKTYTLASAIEKWKKPVLVISHNKVLAAQLYAEFKSFFPDSAVEYFISYYDYYQPEAYIAQTDTYIEKDAAINEHIEQMRLKATTSLLSRKDVIVVASVSAIYNVGDPGDFSSQCVYLETGREFSRSLLLDRLIALQYERNDYDLQPGRFRVRGAVIEFFPPYADNPVRVMLGSFITHHPAPSGVLGTCSPARGEEKDQGSAEVVAKLEVVEKISGKILSRLKSFYLYPAKHFVTPQPKLEEAFKNIEVELIDSLKSMRSKNKLLEAQRLEQRTRYDLAMMKSVGFCGGIENYSRHIDGRAPGERPSCLIDYFPKDFLLIIDESHVTIPQLHGMYNGDRS